MPLELQPAGEADAVRAMKIQDAAYADSPFNSVLFPGPFPENGLEMLAEGLVRQRRESATTRWSKVVDTDLPEGDGQMIAFSKWHILPDGPVMAPRVFGEGCNVEACQKLFGGLQEQRGRLMKGPHVCKLSRCTSSSAGRQVLLYGSPERQGAWDKASRKVLP